MKKGTGVFAICAFLSGAVLGPSLGASPSIGAVVQSAEYDATTGVTTVRILNKSHKEISAVDLSLQVTFPDGTLSRAGSTFLQLDLVEGIVQGKGGLLPGAVLNQQIPGYPGPVRATVDLVAYFDGTADVLNERAFERLSADRKARVRALTAANEVLKNALADSTLQHPGATAIAQLESMVAATKQNQNSSKGAAAYGAELLAAIQNIRNRSQSPLGRSEQEDSQLRALIQFHEGRIPLMSVQTDLREVSQP
jgi:hypothetical protein